MKKVMKKMEYKEKLKEYREHAGLTQKEAAGLLGISPAYMSKLESGRRSLSAERIMRLAEIYNIDNIKLAKDVGYKITSYIQITIYDKKTKELIADIGTDDIILRNDLEAEVRFI